MVDWISDANRLTVLTGDVFVLRLSEACTPEEKEQLTHKIMDLFPDNGLLVLSHSVDLGIVSKGNVTP